MLNLFNDLLRYVALPLALVKHFISHNYHLAAGGMVRIVPKSRMELATIVDPLIIRRSAPQLQLIVNAVVHVLALVVELHVFVGDQPVVHLRWPLVFDGELDAGAFDCHQPLLPISNCRTRATPFAPGPERRRRRGLPPAPPAG